MSSVFNTPKLFEIAKQQHSNYVQAHPFPHITLDNMVMQDALLAAAAAFPKPDALEFYQYDNPLEKKLAFDRVVELPTPIYNILMAVHAPSFLYFLEELTGIPGLIPDPYYRGGGIHQIVPGGKLDIHIDFNYYHKLNLIRKLNVLIYLNEDWEEAYGGHLELWSGKKIANQHVLYECVSKILPVFNRMVIFTTSESSYHGHPEPLTCPADRTRKSIATYYYVAPNAAASVASHSTTFIKHPEQPNDSTIDKLREQRNKGRLSSNVASDLVADK